MSIDNETAIKFAVDLARANTESSSFWVNKEDAADFIEYVYKRIKELDNE